MWSEAPSCVRVDHEHHLTGKEGKGCFNAVDGRYGKIVDGCVLRIRTPFILLYFKSSEHFNQLVVDELIEYDSLKRRGQVCCTLSQKINFNIFSQDKELLWL